MPGQSFQERNASFEHMYAPNRAKELFKRHKEINDYAHIFYTRLAWERKTRKNELDKNISMFQRRGDVLYQKLKEVEDRYFAEFGKQEKLEQELALRPATHLGISNGQSFSPLDRRPKTSHPTLITTPKKTTSTEGKERPSSVIESLPRSRNSSRPQSGLKQRATTASGVRFADTVEDDYHGLKPLPVEMPPDHPNQTNRFLRQRARRKSVFALTKAKQFELRNEGFKEDIMIFQEELREKIDGFLYRLERYKEDCQRQREAKKPPSTPSVTSTEDISGHNKMSDKFKVKLNNPYSNRNTYSLNTTYPNLQSKSSESMKSAASVRSAKSSLQQKSETSVNSEIQPSPKLRERTVSQLSSTSVADAKTPSPLKRDTITRTLSIASRTSSLGEGKTVEEMRKERVKLLYLDAHGELDDDPEAFKEPVVTQKKPHRIKSNLELNTQEIEVAFDEFMEGKKEGDDLKRLIALTAKMKHRVRKRRDKSIVPFLAVRKAARLWKTAARMNQANEAFKDGIREN